MQLALLVNVKRVSHGSPPYLPAPAVLFMSGAGENDGDGFFKSGSDSFSLGTHNESLHNIPYDSAHNSVCGLKTEGYQKHNTAAKVEAVMGSHFFLQLQLFSF